MRSRKSQNLLQGASILGASIIIVKLVGAVFKIPLGSILDGEGLGYYSTAYSIFSMIFAFSTAGLPAAVAKMVAEQSVRQRYQDIRRIHSLSIRLFVIMGIAGFVLMAAFSPLYVWLASDNQGALWSVLAISPAILFGCMTSAYRGYYEGLRGMKPTAVSQIIEVFAKLIFGLALSGGVLLLANHQFESSGVVFGHAAATAEEMRHYAMPFAAAAAILGVTISTFVGTLYLMLVDRRRSDGITEEDLRYSPRPIRTRVLLVQLIKIAIPISLSSIVINVAQFIDTFTIINRLDDAFTAHPDQMLAIFGGLVPENLLAVEGGAANFIYGAYAGYALSVFNLVPSFTAIFGKSALPNITAAWSAHDRKATWVNIQSVIRMTCLIAMPASLGILAMSQPILSLLYPARVAEVAIAAPVLSLQGISLIFLGLSSPLFAVLQGLGRADLPPKFMLVGAILKFVVNWVSIGIPEINVQGAAAGTVSCYATILILSLIWLHKITGFRIHFIRLTYKTLIASILCAVTAYSLHRWVMGAVLGEGGFNTLLSIGCGALVYLAALLLLRGISKDDVLMLPKGEKFAKLLAKYHLLG